MQLSGPGSRSVALKCAASRASVGVGVAYRRGESHSEEGKRDFYYSHNRTDCVWTRFFFFAGVEPELWIVRAFCG